MPPPGPTGRPEMRSRRAMDPPIWRHDFRQQSGCTGGRMGRIAFPLYIHAELAHNA